ncbi:DUF1295-domain-containing protein [Tilletiaria anomala UBC 951]|uniref:DUF1295-domain-containing protein n=1 Tax=Tilletiaria anomala (strain ATCC 24038 / CBS 436.72 / UBC 951) TaxID=1037660 RepID=A0A066VL11_TILAU|nr:DUF1295-domain-containing protein [Tilletiaria anomala UBC 951]KDN39444.1 DUF1295-domain-containing protein [Tilletiaria anomala UBC 951]
MNAHPALNPNTHLVPALRSAWPAIKDHFAKHGALKLSSWISFYQHADVMHSGIVLAAFFIVYVYVMQQITGNASQVDGLWTFLPVIFCGHFTLQKFIANGGLVPAETVSFFGKPQKTTIWDIIEPRLALILVLELLWCVRLTFHAIRRGMFKKGEEDYRWPLLRAKMLRWQWELFTLFFIAITQIILLAVTALPSYILLTTKHPKHVADQVPRPINHLTVADGILACLLVTNLVMQFFADQQQWTYQNFKRGKDVHEKPLTKDSPKLYTEADVARGFVTKGLWAYCRHPNFACEQATWWILYMFVPLTFLPTNPSAPLWRYAITYAIASPLIMNILFLSSTRFSEAVSAGKYPEYKDYQKRVGMFLPLDTFLRAIYFKTLVPTEQRYRVEANVWGAPASLQKKT